MTHLSRSLSAAVAGAVYASIAATASADLIAGWTITTAFPTGTGNVPTGTTYSVGAADQGVQTAGSQLSSVHALAAATYTSPAGNGSLYSFSSNNWSPGDYYEARLSTANYTNISLSWDQARSSTGPASFALEFSVNGGATWTFVSSYTVLQSGGGGAPGTWSTTTANPIYSNTSLLTGAENATELLIRFRSTEAVVSASSGSNRIDNVMVNGTLIPTPGAVALLGVAGLIGGTRRRR